MAAAQNTGEATIHLMVELDAILGVWKCREVIGEGGPADRRAPMFVGEERSMPEFPDATGLGKPARGPACPTAVQALERAQESRAPARVLVSAPS